LTSERCTCGRGVPVSVDLVASFTLRLRLPSSATSTGNAALQKLRCPAASGGAAT
jgi:hypothetical protein